MTRQQVRELIAALIALPILYAGFYYLMLEPGPIISPLSDTGWSRLHSYRLNSPKIHILLQPMHRLDRLIRPEFWYNNEFFIEETPYKRQ